MTKSPLPLMDSVLLGPLLALTNVYFGGILPEVYVLIGVMVRYCEVHKVGYTAKADSSFGRECEMHYFQFVSQTALLLN